MSRTTHRVIRDRAVCRAHGIAGVLARPASGAQCAVVVIGGSEGGMHERDAVALAEEGFAALALAYFGAPGVRPPCSTCLSSTSAGRSTCWRRRVSRRARSGCSAGPAAERRRCWWAAGTSGSGPWSASSAAGWSRTASTTGRAAGRDPPVVRTGLDRRRRTAAVPAVRGHPRARRTIEPTNRGAARRLRGVADGSRRDGSFSIPVERIRGGVLLVAGEPRPDVGLPRYHRVAADRLAGHPYPWANVVLDSVGHLIAGPPGA